MGSRSHAVRRLRNWIAAVAVSAAGTVAVPSSAAAATAAGCGFAAAGTGTYASTLCWLDLSGYDGAQAANGQDFTVSLPGGYTLAFTLTVSGGPVAPHALPSYGGAYLGNTGHYSGVAGRPALYQTAGGTTTTATVSNIAVTDAAGDPITGYALVGADAEATDTGESLTWTANVPLQSINPLGNACGGGFTGAGTTTVTCAGKTVSPKTGTAILAAENPSTITQRMVGGGLQAFAFGVLISRVQLNKAVVNGFAGDSFAIAVRDPSGNVVGSADTAGGSSASTGQLTVLTGAGGEDFTLSESATAGTLGNYTQSWACTRNGAGDPSVAAGSGPSAPVHLGVGDFEDCTITNTARAATLSLAKHAGTPVDVNGDGLVDAGDTIGYTFDVRNTGELTLDDVGVTDAKIGPVTCSRSTLTAGQAMTCTADPYPITDADVTAGAVDNTATATGTPAGATATISSSPSSTHTPVEAPNPAITVVKSASPDDADHFTAKQMIIYSFVVTNTGNVPLTDVRVDDNDFSGANPLGPPDCPGTTLAPKAQMTCTVGYPIQQRDVDNGRLVNSATATGTPPNGPPVASPPSTVTIPAQSNPGIALQKTADPATITRAGQRVGYRYVITNTGNVTLHDLSVAEQSFNGAGAAPVPSCPATPPTLAPGQQLTCTATYVATQQDIDSGGFLNSATASGTAPDGDPVMSEQATANVTATRSPQITLVKTANPAVVSAAGELVTYTFVATNTGNVTLRDVVISEGAFSGTGPLTALVCSDPLAVTLAPGAALTCTADYSVTQDDVDAGIITNTALAGGAAPNESSVTASAGATVTAAAAPAITVVKSASPDDVAHFTPGQTISYRFLVTNTGNVTLRQVAVTETDFTGTGTMSPISCPGSTLAPAEQLTCTASYPLTQADVDAGQISNTATATGLPPSGPPTVSPPSSVTVPGDQAPALALAKAASPTTIGTAGVPIRYTFVITNTGNVTVRDVGVREDAFSGTGRLSAVSCPAAAAALAPGAQVTCTASYTATQADVDHGSITNTATATGTAPGGPVTSDPASAVVASAAAGALAAHKTAHAVDVNHDGRIDPGDRIDWTVVVTNVGTATVTGIVVHDATAGPANCPATSLAPGASMTCTVPPHAITAADANAGRVSNTVTVNAANSRGTTITSDPSSASVTVSHPPASSGSGGGKPLASTGRDLELPVILGAALLAGGSMLLLLTLRRRRG